jgi:hypothetical protein
VGTAPRRVVLHAGMPKTGSSALQVAFVRNESVLEELGVHYPISGSHQKAAKGKVTTGNATELAGYLRRAGDEVPAALELVDRALDGSTRPIVLFSSELLFYAHPAAVAALKDHLARRGYDVSLAIFVRDFVPWVLSSYAQHVQKRGYTGDLREFVDEFTDEILRVEGRLAAFADVVGPSGITLMHYETHRDALAEHFFSTALANGEEVPSLRVPGQVNRTLSSRELGWMRLINTRLDSDWQQRLVGDALVQLAPVDELQLRAGRDDLARITDLCELQVKRINETFFGGRAVVQAGADPDLVEVGEPIEVTELESHLLALAAEIAEKVPSERGADAEKAKLREQLLDERRRRRVAQRALKRLQASSAETGGQRRTAPGAVGRRLTRAFRPKQRPDAD